MHAQLACKMCHDDVAALNFDTEHRIGQCFNDLTMNLYCFFFVHGCTLIEPRSVRYSFSESGTWATPTSSYQLNYSAFLKFGDSIRGKGGRLGVSVSDLAVRDAQASGGSDTLEDETVSIGTWPDD